MNLGDKVKKDKRAVIVVAHEDDMEILGFHPVFNLLKAGYDIYEIIMTDGRFGSLNTEINGPILKKIRFREAVYAARIFPRLVGSSSKINVEILGFIDGFLPFSSFAVNLLKKKLVEISPSIAIGMDPFFPLDFHHDHINTGRIFYFALKTLPENLRPRLCFFIQSFKSDIFIKPGDIGIFSELIKVYRSQITPIHGKFMAAMGRIAINLRRIKSRGKPSAGLRKIRFNRCDTSVSGIRDSILRAIAFRLTRSRRKTYQIQYKPRPIIGSSEKYESGYNSSEKHEIIDPRYYDASAEDIYGFYRPSKKA